MSDLHHLDPNDWFPSGAGVPKKRCQTCFNFNWFCTCGLEEEDPLTQRFVKDLRVGNRASMSPADMFDITIRGIADPEHVCRCIERAATIVKAEQEADDVVDAFSDLLGKVA